VRTHSRFERYALRIDRKFFTAAANAANLVAARLEPAYSSRFECWIDAIFMLDGRVALVPFVQVEGPMLLVREASPFVWPSWLPLDPCALEGIEEQVEPWLRTLAMFDATSSEQLRLFSDDPHVRARIDAARTQRFLCAAPIEAVLVDAAPYIYAQRFAAQRRIAIRAPQAAFGAAMLAASAGGVCADLGDSKRNEFARAWFDADVYGDASEGTYDLVVAQDLCGDAPVSLGLEPTTEGGTVVSFARPAFPSIVGSFDVSDSAPARHFRVRSPEPALRPSRLKSPPVIGGSSGRIGIIVRDDGLRAPEADTDQAQALAAALRAQAFDASVIVASAARADAYDLIHLFGYRHVAQFERVLSDARTSGVPVVITPGLDDFEREAAWGSAVVTLLTSALIDDGFRGVVEAKLAERRLEVGDGVPRGTISYDEGMVRAMLAQARAAIFASEAEEIAARQSLGFSGASRWVPSLGAVSVSPEPVGALCGFDQYVLVHAAFEPRANQAAVLRAAAHAGLPCILTGTVEHGDYYQNALTLAGPGAVWLPQEMLSEGQLSALYAGARVFADFAWSGHGAARIVRAASYGCGLVISSALPLAGVWPGIAEIVDPADVASHPGALRRAWERAPAMGPVVAGRTAELCDPLRSLQAILGCYAEAAAIKTV